MKEVDNKREMMMKEVDKELGLVRPSQPSDHSFPQDLL